MKAYRQGEVLFVPVEIINKEELVKVLENGKKTTVIAEGEAAGHKHEIADPKTATVIEVDRRTFIDGEWPIEKDFEKVLHTDMGTTIKHPDHADLDLPEGTYYIRRQREYDETDYRHVRD